MHTTQMLLISNKDNSDPAVNLALEEFCLKKLDTAQDYLLLYVNQPAVIIGAHQNPWEEIDARYIKRRDIPIYRRMSGGGAVYHDTGNLNFSFITNHRKETFGRFEAFTRPIIDTLNRLGVEAVHAHRNCIEINGKKISGNAQYADLKRMLSHGTLLFSTDLDVLNRALNSDFNPESSKAISSVKREVTNVSQLLTHAMSLGDLTDILIDDLTSRYGDMAVNELSNEFWSKIDRLADQKYRSWEWIYGRSPKFIVRENCYLSDKHQPILIHVVKGIIHHIENEANRASAIEVSKIAETLVGKRYHPDRVRRALTG